MKNKKLICLIAILCVFACACSIIFTACNTDTNNGSDNGTDSADQKPLDFSTITEEDLKGEKLTEEQWKKAFDTSNYDNVTIDVGVYSDTTASYQPYASYYLELNSKRIAIKLNYEEARIGFPAESKLFIENNKVYEVNNIVDETKTIDRNHIAFLWTKEGTDKSPEYLDSMKEGAALLFYKEQYNDFEYKDGAYCAGSLKITFKNGKLYMVYDQQAGLYVYRNYGKTTVTLPKDFITEDDIPDVENCKHEDKNNNDFCDICWEYICKHIDEDKNGYCDLCVECMGHIDEDNNGRCDICHECMGHVDEDNDDICDNCHKCIKHVDDNKDGRCDLCMSEVG